MISKQWGGSRTTTARRCTDYRGYKLSFTNTFEDVTNVRVDVLELRITCMDLITERRHGRTPT
jgi:hypothetical protein